ncbi:hypothetical protein AB0N81_04080 [Streptomyces sp. NPDC093510]|uniref:hypothetical protein n=1 Tax=Streptomyces sp. NPDC093510 TaxID=3155199 RepID=UPI00341B38BD
MVTSTYRTHRRRLGACALLLGAALALTACGDERPGTTDAAAPKSSEPHAPKPSESPGASPYVEPGVVDGAPHNRENNAYRRPGEVSVAGRMDAQVEADRMKPVLERLRQQKKWDPESVRAALTDKLGYASLETGGDEQSLAGKVDVREMYPEFDGEQEVTPEGAMIGLYVGDDACVTAYVGKSGHGATATGRFMETGCIVPPTGH